MATAEVVPRLNLDFPRELKSKEDDDASFKRQIIVALGRSHSQRTPRRDVIFHVNQGTRLEKQRFPVLGSVTTRFHQDREKEQSASVQKLSSLVR